MCLLLGSSPLWRILRYSYGSRINWCSFVLEVTLISRRNSIKYLLTYRISGNVNYQLNACDKKKLDFYNKIVNTESLLFYFSWRLTGLFLIDKCNISAEQVSDIRNPTGWLNVTIYSIMWAVFRIVAVRMVFRSVTAVIILENSCGMEWDIFYYLIIYRKCQTSLYLWCCWCIFSVICVTLKCNWKI